jgi:hypothetical protein
MPLTGATWDAEVIVEGCPIGQALARAETEQT